jgi:hypothetical protein
VKKLLALLLIGGLIGLTTGCPSTPTTSAKPRDKDISSKPKMDDKGGKPDDKGTKPDDKPTKGDDKPTKGDDKPTKGDDKPTKGDDKGKEKDKGKETNK